jgi:hypothetical protein
MGRSDRRACANAEGAPRTRTIKIDPKTFNGFKSSLSYGLQTLQGSFPLASASFKLDCDLTLREEAAAVAMILLADLGDVNRFPLLVGLVLDRRDGCVVVLSWPVMRRSRI